MTNEVEIVKTLTPYLLAFPHCKANEGTLVIYARALSSYNVAEINAAMLKLMRRSRTCVSSSRARQVNRSCHLRTRHGMRHGALRKSILSTSLGRSHIWRSNEP